MNYGSNLLNFLNYDWKSYGYWNYANWNCANLIERNLNESWNYANWNCANCWNCDLTSYESLIDCCSNENCLNDYLIPNCLSYGCCWNAKMNYVTN